MLNVDTKIPLIPNDYQLRNSRLEATFMSRLNSSIWLNLPRNYPINSLVPTNPCTPWHPFCHSLTSGHSPCCTPGISCLHVGTSNYESDSQSNSTHPTNHCWWWTGNLKSPKSLTPRLTTDVCACKLLYLVHWTGYLRALMKKLPVSSLPSLDMLPNLLQIPLCISSQVWSSSSLWLRRTSVFEVLFEVFTFTSQPVLFTILLSHSGVYYWYLYLLRTQAIL